MPSSGDNVIDATGLTLAPGFIDTHSHADGDIFELPDALAAVSQGITTVVVGQDGESPFPLANFLDRLEESPAAVNLASYSSHGTLRSQVMKDDFRRPATEEEVERMRQLLRQEMEAGALGLGAGLEYDPVDLFGDRGSPCPGARGSVFRRPVHLPRPKRGSLLLGGDQRGDTDRAGGRPSGQNLAHEARDVR